MNNIEYDLSELDAAISSVQHQAADVGGPAGRTSATPRGGNTAPGTRRGSLMPVSSMRSLAGFGDNGEDDDDDDHGGDGHGNAGDDTTATTTTPAAAAGPKKAFVPRHLRERNLFHFDLREQVNDLLLSNHNGSSRVSYHEYAVFAPQPDDPGSETTSSSVMQDGDEALTMFRNAVKNGHGLNNEGDFTAKPRGADLLQGRTRQVIVDRRIRRRETDQFESSTPDGLTLTVQDYDLLGLHAATLPSLQRVTVESLFWDSRRQKIHIILSFSNCPQPPYDFLSMRFNVRTRTTTALIRRSFDARWHDEDALDEYERRLDSCRARWAHPLVLPIVLLQVQLYRTEEEVSANNSDVLMLEAHVDAVTGTTGQANAQAWKKNKLSKENVHQHGGGPLRRLATIREKMAMFGRHSHDFSAQQQQQQHQHHQMMKEEAMASSIFPSSQDGEYVPPQTIHLMKEAHDVLKGSIQLLDTLRWMERAVKLVIQAGDELDERIRELRRRAVEKGQMDEDEDDQDDELSHHWHEMRQYLDCTWRLCTALETDRRMSELRCRAQIDIIYSKMAQEDNNLNARMAVASTRDSSSMKALAVITAIFLPGEYIGTLFGVSMFDWEWGTKSDPSLGDDAPDDPQYPRVMVMPSFWIYWAFTVPLTLFIVAIWRAWWVNQDRYFRRHLSLELSNERYWTTDGKPRDLDTSFMHDFFSVLSLSGGGNVSNDTIVGGGGGGGGVGPKNQQNQLHNNNHLMHDHLPHANLQPSGIGPLQCPPPPQASGGPEPGFLRRAWTLGSSMQMMPNMGPSRPGDGITASHTAPVASSSGMDPEKRRFGINANNNRNYNVGFDDDETAGAERRHSPPRFRAISFAGTRDSRKKEDASAV